MTEKDPKETGQSPKAAAKTGPDLDLLVERWFQDHFPNSPVSRDTDAWNTVYKAKENLKSRLRQAGKGE